MVKFSIIIPVFNSENTIKECLDSVLKQNFKDFEIICINDGSHDNSLSILEDYAKDYDFINLYTQKHKGPGAARNYGMEFAEGEYIHFLDSDDKLSANVLWSVNKFFNKNEDVNVVSIPIYFFNNYNHALNNKFNRNEDSKNRIFYLNENSVFLQSSVNSCFFRRESIGDLKFDTLAVFDEGLIFINKILLQNNKIGLVKDCEYFYRRFDSNSLKNTAPSKKEFYSYRLKSLKELYDYSVENKNVFNTADDENNVLNSIEKDKHISANKKGKAPKFIQCIITYALTFYNGISKFPEDMDEGEITEFWNLFYELLENINDDVLTNPFVIGEKISYFGDYLCYIKNKKEFHISEDEEGYTCLKTGDYTINRLENHRIFFDIIELKEGVLNLSGNYVSSCKKDVLNIEAIKTYNGKKVTFKGRDVEYPMTPRETIRILGIDWRFDYNFEFKIPIDKNGETKIDFHMIYEENGKKIVMKNNIAFRKFAEISKFSHYYIRDNQILAVVNKTFIIMPFSYKKALRYEFSSIKSILISRPKYFGRSIFYRLLYLISSSWMKNKDIYLFMDRRENTGDNGEHLFRYAASLDDGIVKYFAVQKDCREYKKLKKEYGNQILSFGSFKHKFYYMHVKKLISSQGYKKHINPFADYNLKLVQGISSPPVYFLQHGVGKYDMRSWLRKYDINFSLILTVSDYDWEAFVRTYNYDEKIIQKLGFPRYDNLTNENLKKEIVIIPTWRKDIISEEALLSSEYFKRWNNLLNDKKVIDFANEKGYDIVFKPHPNSMRFLDLFDTENVTVDTERRFHDVLCESVLMITDYSSVNFDFAYLKKPVIYYQYGNDYHFEGEALIDDEISTFGDIIDDEDILTEKIIEYIDNDCKMEDKYVSRVLKFFKFNDKNNSKRVYDWILKH